MKDGINSICMMWVRDIHRLGNDVAVALADRMWT